MEYLVENHDSLDYLLWQLRDRLDKYGPFQVNWEGDKVLSRSEKQNKLAFKWYEKIAAVKQDDTKEGVRAYCKLHFGIPIRREEEPFREVYDRVIRPLTYAQKLEIMVGAIDFPVTRDMKVKQFARYLNDMEVFWEGQGMRLPKPEDLYFDALGVKRQ